MTIRHIQRWVIAFLPHLSQFHKSWMPPNRVKLSRGSLSKRFSLSAFHTPGLIRRNHPLLIGLLERRPNRRWVLRGLDWLRLIPQLRQWLQMAPFVALEKGREKQWTYIHSHSVHLLVPESLFAWAHLAIHECKHSEESRPNELILHHFCRFVAPNVYETYYAHVNMFDSQCEFPIGCEPSLYCITMAQQLAIRTPWA